ncbi:WD40 repeat-like protein [Mycena crocata]|nr:WD40 repeat-like protein [Mycena crocata]
MSVFPHSQLRFASTSTVVISGPHIQILDSRTGDLIATTTALEDADKAALLRSGPVRLAAIDSHRKHLVTSGDDKELKLWRIDGLKLLNQRELPKKPTGLAFTQDGQTILASDKFGDIFSYSLHADVSGTIRGYDLNPPDDKKAPDDKKKALASHDNPSGGRLILGHASFLTAFILSPDEKFIITADRDEHIRVSWYPQGYTIETYCLGHQKFVSAINMPSPSELISGGGDPMLKIWDWMTGKIKREILVLPSVEPFIKVKPFRRTPRRFGNDDGGGDVNTKRGRKAKGRANNKARAEANEASASASPMPDASGEPEPADPSSEESVFALGCIESLKSDMDDTQYLIFSAFGATALFLCPYSDDPAPDIDAFDFQKPVIDFTITSDGLIWVSLDGQWSESGASTIETAPVLVRVVRLSAGKLVEVSGESTAAPLLASLNSKCVLPATAAELKTLDLYLPLSALPKNNDAEHDPMDREPIEHPGEKEISRKELGRLKSKQAVAKKVQTRPTDNAELDDERGGKRAKSEHELDTGSTDVVMDERS